MRGAGVLGAGRGSFSRPTKVTIISIIQQERSKKTEKYNRVIIFDPNWWWMERLWGVRVKQTIFRA